MYEELNIVSKQKKIINMYVYLYVIPTEFGGITELKSIEQKFNHIYDIIERICNQTDICN